MTTRFDTRIRPEVGDLLGGLRRKIRYYVCAQGAAIILFGMAILFWLSNTIDRFWVRMTKFELAIWFRVFFDILVVTLIVTGFVYWIGIRLFRSMRQKSLALVLERRFPGLNDRLVASVELAESTRGDESPLTVSMLNRTVETARRDAKRIRVGEVFNIAPLRLAILGALVGVLSVVSFGVLAASEFERWVNAYLGMKEVYVVRDTHLRLQVVAPQPPNRNIKRYLREFAEVERDGGKQWGYKHLRGTDLMLQVVVPDLKNENGKRYEVPEEVELHYVTAGGKKDSKLCNPSGDRRFTVQIDNVIEDLDIWIEGGDFKNRRPYHIEVVKPPQAGRRIQLTCEYPDFTTNGRSRKSGWDRLDYTGVQVNVPMETRFVLDVPTGRTLRYCKVVFGDQTLEFGVEPVQTAFDRKTGRHTYGSVAVCRLKNPDVKKPQDIRRQRPPRNFFHKDHQGIRLPFVISQRLTKKALAGLENPFPNGLGKPFFLKPGKEIRIYFEDSNQIRNTNPVIITVNTKPDEVPAIKVAYIDIDSRITQRARIPLGALIEDDYGIAGVKIEYRVIVSARPIVEPGKEPVVDKWVVYTKGKWPDGRDRYLETPLPPQPVDVSPVLGLPAGGFLLSRPAFRNLSYYQYPAGRTREFRFHRRVVVGDIIGVNLETHTFSVIGAQADDLQPDKEGDDDNTGGIFVVDSVDVENSNIGHWSVKAVGGGKTTEIVVARKIKNASARGRIEKNVETDFVDVADILVKEPDPSGKGQPTFRRLKPGDRLKITVTAVDADNFNGPHLTRSRVLDFEIVYDEDVKFALYQKETDQRKSFEDVITEVEKTRAELADRLDEIGRWRPLRKIASENGKLSKTQLRLLQKLGENIKQSAARGVGQVRQSQNETESVEREFRLIRARMINNGLYAREASKRLGVDIIKVLAGVNRFEYNTAAESIRRYKEAVQNGEDPADAVDQSLQDLDRLLIGLRKALNKMKQLVTFHKAIQELYGIKKAQEKLKELTRIIAEKEALEQLKKLQNGQKP